MDPKFTIDGREYDVPRLSTYDMDEWEILYEKTGLTLETIDDAPLSPGLLRTMLIVAYRRGNPGAKAKQIEQVVGALNFGDVVGMLTAAGAEDDADPPALATSSSPPEPTANQTANGPSSAAGSGTLAVVPPPTGTPLSATLQTSSQAVSGS